MKIIKENRGITLLVLAITIVIILILAGISIDIVFSENGIIDKAKEIANNMNNQLGADQAEINDLLNELENSMKGPEDVDGISNIKVTTDYTTEEITINVEVETTSEDIEYEYYIDGELKSTQKENSYTEKITLENKEPYIPNGFSHTEGTVDTGYVIKDTSVGNEFVWIPVASGTFDIYVVAKDEEGNSMKSDEIALGISELTRKVNGSSIEYTSWEEEDGDIKDKKSIAYFKESVVKNSGFYMGRYEMGMPGQKSGDAPVLEFTREARNIEGVPVCVGQVMPWTHIDWSTAKKNLESMYNGEVESAMMNSYARTTMLNWLMKTGAKTLAELESSGTWGIYRYDGGSTYGSQYILNFRGNFYEYIPVDGECRYGRYNNYTDLSSSLEGAGIEIDIMIDTGADTIPAKVTAANNIYDLAGNAGEWSTEGRKDDKTYRISGGSFKDSYYAQPARDPSAGFHRNGTIGDDSISSRPILYK